MTTRNSVLNTNCQENCSQECWVFYPTVQPTFAALQFELHVNVEKYFQLEFDTIFKNCVFKFCFPCL